MYYRRFTSGLNDRGKLIPSGDSVFAHGATQGPQKDYYLSVFKYNQEQYDKFQQIGSVKGVTDVVTDRIVFDFDSSGNIEVAQKDAYELCSRLLEKGMTPDNLQISFSGGKGFHVEVQLTEDITVSEYKAIVKQLIDGLESADSKILDHARVFRVLGSINLKSGLYKIPLFINELMLPIEEIKAKAANLSNVNIREFREFWKPTALPEEIQKLKTFQKEDSKTTKSTVATIANLDDLDWSAKPKFLSNCRYALKEGFFEAGERNKALHVLAARYRNLGFDRKETYRLLKATAEKQAERTGTDKLTKQEIWETIILHVYSDGWNGGQYTCKDQGSWLYDYCETLGEHRCEEKATENLVTADKVFDLFKDYTHKYEENILYTGIPELDQKVKLMVGTSNGILAPPGVGKTSLCLQILEYNSQADVPCLFYSYDMFHSALYLRMFQHESGLTQDDIFAMMKERPDQLTPYIENINAKFNNVQFCFKAGQTIDELEETLDEAEEKLGRKPKLVMVDYNELIQTAVPDPTAASAAVAQRLRAIANEREVCMVTLLQPSKQFTTPADEIVNFNSVKGSSAIVQSLTTLLGCSRPGFNPTCPEEDKFFNITCLKNRNGPLFTLDFSWDGLQGRIGSLTDSDRRYLKDLRALKAAEKANKEAW